MKDTIKKIKKEIIYLDYLYNEGVKVDKKDLEELKVYNKLLSSIVDDLSNEKIQKITKQVVDNI